jgi:hypothetical protein
MKEAIAVEARFELDGSIRPLNFIWRGHRYRIRSVGRQWDEESKRHFLVMVLGERVYELVYLPTESTWHLSRRPEDFGGREAVV